MCYQFSHNEQEAQWQSDIIYGLALTHRGGTGKCQIKNKSMMISYTVTFET